MKTFPSYDYTLCNQEDCVNKQNCLRYTTYKKAIKEKYKYTISVFRPKEIPANCNLYEPTKSK